MNLALMNLTRRAEGTDRGSLVATFVNVGSLASIVSSQDHQILYGRRGTGKTHILQYLSQLRSDAGDIAVYIDMRTIGSTGGLYGDPAISITERGTRLVVDTLTALYDALVTEVIQGSFQSDNDFTAAMAATDKLEASLSDVRVTGEEEIEATAGSTDSHSAKASAGAKLGASLALSAAVSGEGSQSAASGSRHTIRGTTRHRVHFGSVFKSVSQVVSALPGRVWVLLDEWSVVPLDLQPLLADLLRRCLLPVKGITVKIAAIEQRSRFIERGDSGGYLGLELGPDISADVDLDDFMVFGNDAAKSKQFFSELLFKHVAQSLPEGADIKSADDFIRIAFTQKNAFEELVRAAEGVPRDAINIAMIAAQSAGDELISVPVMRGAARRWYIRDKEKAVEANSDAMDLLHWVIDEVIAGRKARAFLMLQSEAGASPLVNSLYDARVLHVIKRGVAAHDQPGVRFNVYALDYGCYVELINTANAPKGLLNEGGGEDAIYFDVPPDDYRSIRRAILTLGPFESRSHT